LELLVKFISMHLSTKGQAGILLPAYRGEEVLELLKKYVLYPAEIAFVQQTASHTAFRIMLLVQKTETHPREMQIIIKENDGKYSDAFSQLLSDYYLYL